MEASQYARLPSGPRLNSPEDAEFNILDLIAVTEIYLDHLIHLPDPRLLRALLFSEVPPSGLGHWVESSYDFTWFYYIKGCDSIQDQIQETTLRNNSAGSNGRLDTTQDQTKGQTDCWEPWSPAGLFWAWGVPPAPPVL